MHVRSTKFFCRDVFSSGSFNQGRTSQKYGSGAFNNDRLIAHRWHISSASRAGAHYHRNLRYLAGTHPRLVIENTSKMHLVWEDLVLHGQVCAPRIDQINTGQGILLGDLLGSQVFFNGYREIRATFYGSIVGDNHHLMLSDMSDASDNSLAYKQFALLFVSLLVFLPATLTHQIQPLA